MRGVGVSVHGQHRDYYLALAERAEPELHGPNQLAWLDTLETEHDNFRAALGWSRDSARDDWAAADAEAGLRLATALGQLWLARGHLSEGRQWLTAMLELALHGTIHRAKGLYQAAWLALFQGDLHVVSPLVEASLSASQALAYRFGVVLALHLQAALEVLVGNSQRSAELLDAALPTFAADGSNRTRAMWLYARAQAARALGKAEQAVELAREGLAVSRVSRDPWEIRHWVILLGHLELHNDPQSAATLLREGLAISQQMRDRQGTADGIESLGWASAACGESDRAARLLGAAAAVRDSIGLQLLSIWDVDHDRAQAMARKLLGDGAFEAASAAGRTLALEDAIAFALSDHATDIPLGRSDVDPLVAGLTHREREVATLLTGGLSNRQIAETLIITEGTAAIHVRNILNKLGFDSRAQITAWAVRQGLDEPARN